MPQHNGIDGNQCRIMLKRNTKRVRNNNNKKKIETNYKPKRLYNIEYFDGERHWCGPNSAHTCLAITAIVDALPCSAVTIRQNK